MQSKERKSDKRKREGGGEREREPCRNKLAVSCRGTEGETKMDTLMLFKSERWVEAYSSPRPFSQHSSGRLYKPFSLIHKRMYMTLITSTCATRYRKTQKSQFAWRSCRQQSTATPTELHMCVSRICSFSREVRAAAETEGNI